jgi:hypothetical protein
VSHFEPPAGAAKMWPVLRYAEKLKRDPLDQPERRSAIFGGVVAGACFGATKTHVVCFSLERRF